MMIAFLVLGIVASALGSDGLDKVYSIHTEGITGSLNLTTVELKQFSGHALNIIHAKCPAVDSQKIFQVQKYIGKLLAKRDPQPGASKEFPSLLQAITNCEKEGVTPKPKRPFFPPGPIFQYFHPFNRLRVFKEPHADTGMTTKKPSISHDRVISATPRRIVTTTIFIRPEDMREGIQNSGGFFNWIHNLMAHVTHFFRRMNPFHRSKRDVASDPSAPIDTSEPIPLAPYQVFSPKGDESKAKRAFGSLVDEMCRIYCAACSNKEEIENFKRAAKQLLDDLLEEDSGLEAAAAMYLDNAFMHSIAQCDA